MAEAAKRLDETTAAILGLSVRFGLLRELVDQRDLAQAELASARAELERLRYSGWIVARDGGRTCEACDHEIRRGEAYAIDTTGDELRHVFCPTTEGDGDA